jgi:hypothetical protein
MPIFIAKTYDGSIESVVLARSYELAQAYWQGKGIHAHSVDERDESNLNDHPTGVLPIIKTKRINMSGFGREAKEYLVVSRE